MAVNLIRNSRVFFTTNLDSFGRVKMGAHKDPLSLMTATNCFELQVLEGLSFSQNTAVDTVTLNEAGAAPVRGQRSFNTALEPVDFTFSTYIRPHNTGSLVTCEESYLWNAFAGPAKIGSTTPIPAAWVEAASAGTLSFEQSNKHQLQAFGLIILFDSGGYVIDNCALDSATVDFGIDAIAAVAWAGKGSAIRVLSASQASTATPVEFSGADFAGTTVTDKALAKNTAARFITNKLSTLVVNDGINDFSTITGGTVTSVTVGNAGSGYTSVPTVTFGAAPAGGTLATGTAVISGGGVSAAAVATPGTGYTGATVVFSAPQLAGGVAATGTVTVATGGVTAITITTPGTGYTSAPTATISGDGTGATAGAITITGSTITGVNINNPGAGYITAPTVTISGGGGTGATATAVIPTGVSAGGSVYTIALTGGNITFSNNLTYLTPANLGIVNLPITYFTGTRAISGSINAYLKTGSLESGGLLSDLLASSSTTVDPKFTINVQLGGPSTNLTGVEIKLPAAMLQIPTINTEQVISTTINFTAQGYAGTGASVGYDITASNEASIVYRAAV